MCGERAGIALVDAADGNLDLIEVNKPFDESEYRGNGILASELSGRVMLAERNLLGEKTVTVRYADELPKLCRSG